MSETIKLDVVSPTRQVYAGDVAELVAPGLEGEFGVLPGHAEALIQLQIGTLRLKAGGTESLLFINQGYAEVGAAQVTVLAESAEAATDIDIARAMEAKRRAEERLKLKQEDVDFQRAELALQRALIRIQIAEKNQTRSLRAHRG